MILFFVMKFVAVLLGFLLKGRNAYEGKKWSKAFGCYMVGLLQLLFSKSSLNKKDLYKNSIMGFSCHFIHGYGSGFYFICLFIVNRKSSI